MRDWEAFVRERLAGIELNARECREIAEELASHLDETFVRLRCEGLTEERAVEGALAQVDDWPTLRHKIQNARTEDPMSDRVKQLWLPGAAMFLLAEALLALFQRFGPGPRMFTWAGQPAVAMFYVPWLISLPFIGALGAYLAHRARGSERAMLIASVFPILPMAAFFPIALGVSLAVHGQAAHNITPWGALMVLVCWLLVPGSVLFAGGLLVRLLLSPWIAARS
jgi:uncharacterized membrane protein YgdD (TMEM256/DUF423 family)